jgi:hypothetical protein
MRKKRGEKKVMGRKEGRNNNRREEQWKRSIKEWEAQLSPLLLLC